MAEIALREGLPPLPQGWARMPRDHRGYPVPFFVQWFDEAGVASDRGAGKPDFRVMDSRAMKACVHNHVCWLCGEPMGRYRAYVIGPMCAVNRVSGEPPSHRACAIFAAQACPFMSRPKAGRRDAGLEELSGGENGLTRSPTGIPRNPGVALVWITQDAIKVVRTKPTPLFHVGEPVETLWFAEGRTATREEVLESINTGMPILEESCLMEKTAERQAEARAALASQREAVNALLPAEQVLWRDGNTVVVKKESANG